MTGFQTCARPISMYSIELVDRANVTRLQAEVERLTKRDAEPVAFYDKDSDSLMIIGHGQLEDQQYVYASQPAPVSVVLPERRETGPNYPYLSDLDIEWNACLEKVKELNREQ